MPLHVATASASPRSGSEDRVAVHRVQGGLVVVVADGAGGLTGGAFAADLALELVAETITKATFPLFTATGLFTARPWIELLRHADELVISDPVAGETTLVVVAIAEDGRLVGASCGDSGAMVIGFGGAGDIMNVIDDLTVNQHRKRRLGSGRALPAAFERAVLHGTLLVATDGLFSYARPEVLAGIVTAHKDLDEVAGALVKAVRLPGGSLQDDVVLAVVRSVRR